MFYLTLVLLQDRCETENNLTTFAQFYTVNCALYPCETAVGLQKRSEASALGQFWLTTSCSAGD